MLIFLEVSSPLTPYWVAFLWMGSLMTGLLEEGEVIFLEALLFYLFRLNTSEGNSVYW